MPCLNIFSSAGGNGKTTFISSYLLEHSNGTPSIHYTAMHPVGAPPPVAISLFTYCSASSLTSVSQDTQPCQCHKHLQERVKKLEKQFWRKPHTQHLVYWVPVPRCWWESVRGGHGCPVPNTASSDRFHCSPTAGHG